METIKESIEVNVPVSKAYNQWTQFEEFPKFMESVESVEQLDDTHLHWVAEVSGERREWQAEIVDQVPDQQGRVARSRRKRPERRVVSLRAAGRGTRRSVIVEMSYEPEGLKEQLGSKVGDGLARGQAGPSRAVQGR